MYVRKRLESALHYKMLTVYIEFEFTLQFREAILDQSCHQIIAYTMFSLIYVCSMRMQM